MAPSDAKQHLERIYPKKISQKLSWYLPHLETSRSLIKRAIVELPAAIIDIGGVES